MMFSEIPGNESVKRALADMADKDRVPNAIMFHENDGGGALALVQGFLQYLNRDNGNSGNLIANFSHPDVHYTFPITTGTKVSGQVSSLTCGEYMKYWRELAVENPFFLECELTAALGIEKKTGIISVAEARDILKELSLAPAMECYRAVVVWLPEKMNAAAANSLLKVVEEPEEGTVFLFVTHSPEEVMPTIRSRCLGIRVYPASTEEIAAVMQSRLEIGEDEALYAARLAGGCIGKALFALSDENLTSEAGDLFADLMNTIVSRDLAACLRVGDDMAALDSREKQKTFCEYVSDAMRKIFMLQQGMSELVVFAPGEEDFYRKLAGSVGKTFARRAVLCLNRAYEMINRNVNRKITFCNLALRMFLLN